MVVLILLIRKHAARNGVAYLKSCEPVGELDISFVISLPTLQNKKKL